MIIKTTSLQEANGLLPLIKEHFIRIHLLLNQLHMNTENFGKNFKNRLVFDDQSEQIKLVAIKSMGKKQRKREKEIFRLREEIEFEANELIRLGAVVRSLFPPHIDFRSQRNGRPIYLCWHAPEKNICHWHEVEGVEEVRQKIDEGKTFGPSVVH